MSANRRARGSRAPRRAGAAPLDIVYEDRVLLVINKPAGLLSVPLPNKSAEPSVYDQLERYLRPQRRRPFVVHRIDRDTSGVVVFAKDPRTQQALKKQFIQRKPERIYLALVYGHPNPGEGTWRDHLVWDRKALIQKRTHPRDPQGAEAVCSYRRVEQFREASLLEVRLETGKRNQIRIQARLRGHTLIGERRYVFGPEQLRPIPFTRQALHAYRLAFRHPVDDREMQFEAPLPDDLRALLDHLRQ